MLTQNHSKPLQGTTIVFDVDDTLYPANNGLHDAIKRKIVSAVESDPALGKDHPLTTKKEGNLIYFPQYVLYKFIQGGRNPQSPQFKAAMHECYDVDYSVIKPNPELREKLLELKSKGADLSLYTSGPDTHVAKVLDKLGIADLFPRERITDVTDMCKLCGDITAEQIAENPKDPQILQWFKPTRQSFVRMASLQGIDLTQPTIYLEDSHKNGATAVVASEVPAFVSGQLTQNERLTHCTGNHRWAWVNQVGASLPDGCHMPEVIEPTVEQAVGKIITAAERAALFDKYKIGSKDSGMGIGESAEKKAS